MRKSMAAVAALALPVVFPAAALAQSDGAENYVAELGGLNGSPDGFGNLVEANLEGDQLYVTLTVSPVVAGMPHAMHIHYPGEEGAGTIEGSCPTMDADEDGDGFVSTSEGAPFYGGIVVSLTNEGDVSPDSGLAVDRFETPPREGFSYARTFTVPEGFDAAEDLGGSVIVIHGIDANGNGQYDMDGAGASDLDESLPAEATHPAYCGALSPAAEGGVPSGYGGTSGIENTGLMLAGAGSLAAAAGVVLHSRRRRTQA